MKQQLPFAGAASGQAGGLIYQHYNGNTYVRSKPAIFHYPNTPAQQAQQEKYWSVFTPFRKAYDKFSSYIPEVNRKRANACLFLQKHINDFYAGFEYSSNYRPPTVWGLDPKNEVSFYPWISSFGPSQYEVYIRFYVRNIISERVFNPSNIVCLYVCDKVTVILSDVFPFEPQPKDYYVRFPIALPFGTNIYFYVALCNNEFFTNFYLCGILTIFR